MRGIVVMVLVFLLSFPINIVSGEDEGRERVIQEFSESPPIGSFPPTTIDGDDQLATFISNNNFTGNGTEEDPFIIGDRTFDVTNSSFGLYISNITTFCFRIIDCSFENNDPNNLSILPTGLIIKKCKNININNCSFRGNENGLLEDMNSNIKIINSTFEDLSGHGILGFSGTKGIDFDGCSFTNCLNGINMTVSKFNIRNSTFRNNREYGIFSRSILRDSTVFDSIFLENEIGIEIIDHTYFEAKCRISNNLFAFNNGYGIYSIEDSRIFNNTFIENNNQSGQLMNGSSQALGFYDSPYWEFKGRGNFWSDHNLTDSNYDGETDNRYRLDDIYSTSYDEHPLSYVPQIGIPDFRIFTGNSEVEIEIINWTEFNFFDHIGFRIYRSEDLINWTHVTDLPLPITEYTDKTVWNDHTYYYKVTCLGKLQGYDWVGEGFRGPILNETPNGKASEITFLFPVHGMVYGVEDILVTWTVVDDQDRLESVEISVNGLDWQPYYNNSFLMKGLTNGTYSFGIKARDEAGNTAEKFISFTIDMDDPIVEILNPLPGSYITETPFKIEWRIFDPTTEIMGMSLIVDGSSVSVDLGDESLTLDLKDGSHRINLEAWDINLRRSGAYSNFIVDTVPPMINIISPKWNEVAGPGSLDLEYEVSDITSGVDYVLYRIDNGNWHQAKSETEIDTSKLNHGEHKLELLAEDIAGNIGYDHIRFMIDRRSPSITIYHPVNGSRINRLIDIRMDWEAEDKESGLDLLRIDFDNTSNHMIIEDPEIGHCFLYFSEAGPHTIKVTLFDLAGNSDTELIDIFIDITAPFIRSVNPHGNDVPTSSYFTILFSELMDETRTVISISGVNSHGYFTGPMYNLFPDGDLETDTRYTLLVRGYDLAGNELTLQEVSFTTWKKGTVHGTVREKDGDPIPHVFVNVTGEELEMETDLGGNFQFDLVPGSYEIRFFLTDYKSYKIEVNVEPDGDTIMGDILLERIGSSDENTKGSDGRWIVLFLLLVIGGLLSTGTFLFFYINKGKDESVELESKEDDYLVQRGDDPDEYIKHEGNIEEAKRDLW